MQKKINLKCGTIPNDRHGAWKIRTKNTTLKNRPFFYLKTRIDKAKTCITRGYFKYLMYLEVEWCVSNYECQ